MIDTHSHIDGEEFAADLNDVIARAVAAGVEQVLVPAIDLASSLRILSLAKARPAYCRPMVGLHPEEVRPGWEEQLAAIRPLLESGAQGEAHVIAIGEVGLDFYWSREYAREQLEAFERQVEWSVATRLPLMIHCRKAQNEMVKVLRRYERELPGGVFHCFTGNAREAAELLSFERFVLGVGGVATFKKSALPATLPAAVPLDRLVLETDAPYMAPVPHRGERNEPAFVALVCQRLAEAYGVTAEEMDRRTTLTARRVFGL